MRRLIITLLIVTVSCIAAVEFFYSYLTNRYVVDHKTERNVSDGGDLFGRAPLGHLPDESATAAIIVRRNLFAPGVDDSSANGYDPLADIAESTLGVVLMGTVTGPDEEQRAVIYDSEDHRQQVYRRGDVIRRAVIKQILRGKVIVSHNGRDEVLDIAEARSVSALPTKPSQPLAVVGQTQGAVDLPVSPSLSASADSTDDATTTIKIRR